MSKEYCGWQVEVLRVYVEFRKVVRGVGVQVVRIYKGEEVRIGVWMEVGESGLGEASKEPLLLEVGMLLALIGQGYGEMIREVKGSEVGGHRR